MYVRALDSGTFEGIKAGVHGLALGLSAIMCLYNAAAWLQRRERHLAVNTIVYGGAIILEHQHVAHHCRTLRRLHLMALASCPPEQAPAPTPAPASAPTVPAADQIRAA
jgi:hypothetical protein